MKGPDACSGVVDEGGEWEGSRLTPSHPETSAADLITSEALLCPQV